MTEASAHARAIETTGITYTIKKWQVWLAVIINIVSIVAYIVYREVKFDNTQTDHEKRISALEKSTVMIQETKLNLEQFLKKQGYEWIVIPQK